MQRIRKSQFLKTKFQWDSSKSYRWNKNTEHNWYVYLFDYFGKICSYSLNGQIMAKCMYLKFFVNFLWDKRSISLFFLISTIESWNLWKKYYSCGTLNKYLICINFSNLEMNWNVIFYKKFDSSILYLIMFYIQYEMLLFRIYIDHDIFKLIIHFEMWFYLLFYIFILRKYFG